MKLSRRSFVGGALAAPLLAKPGFGQARGSVLRVIPHADLKNIDPIWTTAYISRNHGYMVYDTLFAMDKDLKPQPQMVDKWETSADGKTWTFVLRDGLSFHDGKPVTAEDCAASLIRWGKRDAMGQLMFTAVENVSGRDARTLEIKLTRPYGLLIDSIAKISSNVPFIMPKAVAETDPFKQIESAVGSGPFIFRKEQWVPGSKVVYEKFKDYVPRKEATSGAAGAKIAKVDRVEWLYIPDAMTKVAALNNGEADWWENPPADVWPVLAANPDVTVARVDPLSAPIMTRFNHTQPPFDNPKMRQAVLSVVDQGDFLAALAGEEQNWERCASFFTCGTPMANEAGSAILSGKRDFDKAKKMIAEAGYKGERVVVMDAVDQPVAHTQALVVSDLLKKLGINVDLQAMDWGQLVTRRASKEPIDKGGYNIFATGWVGADLLDPVLNLPLKTNGDGAWFGWPKDDKIEALRVQWLKAATLDERKKLAAQIQERAFEVVPYLPTGQWKPKTAYRKNLKGVIQAPAYLMWNVEKV